jgi:hypothetical protein
MTPNNTLTSVAPMPDVMAFAVTLRKKSSHRAGRRGLLFEEMWSVMTTR